MALLSNINDKFAVDSTGAIQFNGQVGTSGYVLKSNANAAPTWVDPSTVIGGPYLPLSGGTLTGATATASGISFTVGGTLTGTTATFNTGAGDIGLAVYTSAISTTPNVRFGRNSAEYIGFQIQDRNNRIVFRQDETTGNHEAVFDLWSSTTGNKAFVFGVSNSAGASFLNWLTIENVNATFAGDVQVTGAFKDSSGDAGTSGQILSSTATGTNWIDNDTGDISGSGVAGEVAYFTGTKTIANNAGMSFSNQQIQFDGIGGADGYILPYDQDPGYSNMAAGGFGLLFRESYDSYVTNNTYYYKTGGTSQWRAKYTTKGASVLSMLDGKFNFDTAPANTTSPYNLSLSTKMTILEGGNVGIGISNPVTKLDVYQGDIRRSGITSGGYIEIGSLPGYAANAYQSLTSGGSLHFANNGKYCAYLEGNDTYFGVLNSLAQTKVFFATGSQNSYLAGSGFFGIGTTSPSQKLDVSGNIYASGRTQSGNTLIGTKTISSTNFATLGSNSSGIGIAIARDHAPSSYPDIIINSSGNVGIGTASPAHKLQVNGDSTVNGGRKFGWVYNPGADNNMYNYIQTSITSGQSYAAEPLEISGARWTGGNTRSVIFTHQTGGEIMTIMTGGNVGIGVTSPSYNLDVTGTARITSRLGIGTAPDTAVAGDVLKIQGGNNGLGCIKAISGAYSYGVRIEGSNLSTQLALYTSSTSQTTQINFEVAGNSSAGKITTTTNTTTYTTSSDYRLKENVVPISDSISRLNQLKPSRFNFIEEPNKTVDGFIAHEVQDIVPEAIVGEKDEVDENGGIIPQGIDQAKLVPLLVAAIQELEARVKELENK